MLKTLAIVGSGISAMTIAHYLKNDYKISIFEKNDYLGGHTHTHKIKSDGKMVNVDTGFIVFNLETYKNMLNLFEELGVEKQKTSMSFSVYNQKINLQYSSSGLAAIFAQKNNLYSLKYWKFLLNILHFFKVANRDLTTIKGSEETIQDYASRNNLSEYFIDNYLAPMSAAVWSTPQRDVKKFPIALLLPFFKNHGLLGVGGQFQWYTVKGGSNTYTNKIIEKGNFDIHLDEAVESAEEDDRGVVIKTLKNKYYYDLAVLTSHADQSLKIVDGISSAKKELLGKYEYNPNLAVLHTDESVMPGIKRVWSAWNQVVAESGESSTVYWMNKLQRLETKINYFVSINPVTDIDEDRVIKRINYHHPNFTTENFSLQDQLQLLNQDTKIFFAGAYFGYGFHEDGVKSGLEVVKKLKKLL
jgi:predicted NAD/FAD-binding protein